MPKAPLYQLTAEELSDFDHPANRALQGTARDHWPRSFRITWDYSPHNFHRCLDGVSRSEFKRDYPEIKVGSARLEEIDAVLHGASRRGKHELWGFADEKVTRCILHWSTGSAITPPMLAVNMGKLVIVGGNNRMAVCRSAEIERLPFLFDADHQPAIAAKLQTFSLQTGEGLNHE